MSTSPDRGHLGVNLLDVPSVGGARDVAQQVSTRHTELAERSRTTAGQAHGMVADTTRAAQPDHPIRAPR